MRVLRHILSWILLSSVVLALGDAPYVDELFDALPRHDPQAVAPARAPAQGSDPSRALRIYQALANIFMAPLPVAIAAAAPSRRYFAAPSPSPASADPRSLDRPPAPRPA